jgi:hypothetical protein
MPKALVYNTGDEFDMHATVINGADTQHPVIQIGTFHVAIPQLDLDKADHRDDSYREPTDAERDLAEMAEAAEGEEEAAAKEAAKEAAEAAAAKEAAEAEAAEELAAKERAEADAAEKAAEAAAAEAAEAESHPDALRRGRRR